MVKYLRVDDHKAYDWMKNLIDNSHANPRTPQLQASYNFLEHWKAVLENPVSPKEIIDNIDSQQFDNILLPSHKPKSKPAKSTVKSKSRKTKQAKAKVIDIDPYICLHHKNYHGVDRRPQTDCVTCWSLFKQFNPNRYDAARRDYELKSSKKGK